MRHLLEKTRPIWKFILLLFWSIELFESVKKGNKLMIVIESLICIGAFLVLAFEIRNGFKVWSKKPDL